MNKILWLLLLPLLLSATQLQPKILYVYGSHFSNAWATHVTKELKSQNIEISYKSLKKLKESKEKFDLGAYDLVMLNAANASRSKKLFKENMPSILKESKRVVTVSISEDIKTPKFRKNISHKQQTQIKKYLDNGGLKNFNRFSVYMANEVFKISKEKAKSPIIYPKTAIYHPSSPDKMFTSLQEYLKFLGEDASGKSIVAIAMYQSSFGSIDTQQIDDTIDKLSKMPNIIPVAFYYAYDFSSTKKEIPYKKLLSLDGKFRADAIVFYQMIHQAQKRKREFEELGIPVFAGLIYSGGDLSAYEDDKLGISSFMMPFTLSIPEVAGIINPMIVATRDKKDFLTKTIDYQMDSFLQRIQKYLVLQTKPNAEKKVSFFFWNYPSGQNAMGASFLNISESLASMFKAMKDDGYTTEDVNASYFVDRVKDMMSLWYRDVEFEDLLDRDLCELYPLQSYKTWFEKLPKKVQMQIVSVWGEPEESNMLVTKDGKKYFVIPRMKVGNNIILPQGSRSEDMKENKKSYHDMSIPTSHGYLSVYLYAKEIFGSDAIVHMGTHGSQEWMQGKERGLSIYDSPNLAVGNTPVIYPFIVDDIGEAMNTKRRGSAVSLSHLTPPFSPAGLHDELVDLHELMHQYNDMTDGVTRENTKKEIIKLTVAQSFDKEISANSSEDFKIYLEELHEYMDELANANQPLGLHTYGEILNEKYATLTVMQMLGSAYIKTIESLPQEHHHDDHDAAHEEKRASFMQSYENIDKTRAYTLLRAAIEGKKTDYKELEPYFEKAKKYYDGIEGTLENENFLKALSGKYIGTSTGGDPIRNPDILPTGRNMYGFDPSKVPTKAAYGAGKQLTKDVIANYYAKHGVYPDKLAFSLWSIETMRHYGVLESQILYAMGIKPIWAKGGRVVGMEVISYKDLKRPRIDVVISATGLYRDAFPNVMEFLDEAVRKIVAMKEKNNNVRINALKLEQELIDEGLDKEMAKKLSTVRIFSNASGTYGTGLAGKVAASGSWEEDKDMSDGYISRMGFAFGSGVWGEKVAEKLYAKVLKGTDVAMFSRSSNVYGLLTSDDPFQYLGGIALAVRNLDGKTPELYITNLRNKGKGKVESIEKFMSKEIRTRYTHPQWIKAMQEEGKEGAGAISAMIENAWGWEVMDPNSIRDDQWQEFVEVYVNDKHNLDMKKFFDENNPDALAKITERFLEAIRKGYFKTDEKTIKKLVETYMEVASKNDVFTENETFKEYVKAKAVGYGISAVLPLKVQTKFDSAPSAPSEVAKQVKGQKLEEKKSSNDIVDDIDYLTIFFILFLIFSGIVLEKRKNIH